VMEKRNKISFLAVVGLAMVVGGVWNEFGINYVLIFMGIPFIMFDPRK